jgi:hypothetical protein
MSTKNMVIIAALIVIIFYFFSKEIMSFVSDAIANYLR